MDDASSEIYAGFFVDEEGTASSFRGVSDTLKKHGLFSSFYSGRGSHYWHTPVAGGKVDFNPVWSRLKSSGNSEDSGVFTSGQGAK